MDKRGPDFFIVGGPKCGTTAMFRYLGYHPRIYISERWFLRPGKREQSHYATDLLPIADKWRSRDYYLSMFEGAGQGDLLGDASVFHMVSTEAARNIHADNKDARIIAMVRNPLEMIPSYHSQMLYSGLEDLTDLKEALAAESDRREGKRLPGRLRFLEILQYRKLAHFSGQLMRYFEQFPREQINVIVFDDFVKDTQEAVDGTLSFLGVEGALDQQVLDVVNPNKIARSQLLHRATKRPPQALRCLARSVMPSSLRDTVRTLLHRVNARFNTEYVQRPPLDPRLRDELAEEFRDEVQALGSLLDRDLTHWLS